MRLNRHHKRFGGYVLVLSCVSVLATGACLPGAGSDGGEGKTCGGLAGIPCDDGFYCQFPEGTCGAADQSGACSEIPELCTEQFEPVCGCDDTTYGNACIAAAASVSILSQGECVP